MQIAYLFHKLSSSQLAIRYFAVFSYVENLWNLTLMLLIYG